MAKDPYGFGISPDYLGTLLKYVQENEIDLKRWVDIRPTVEKTYDQLLSDIKQGNIGFNPIPRDNWKQHIADETSFTPDRNVGAYFGDQTITFPEDAAGVSSFPHEIKHYFASHKAGQYGAPKKINPYIKTDVALKGWLPSFHPAGRRPTLPEGPLGIGKWWNEKHATEDAEYSNKYGYHPWLDEDAFDEGEAIKQNLFDIANKSITKQKPVKKDPIAYRGLWDQPDDFKEAVKASKAAGTDVFTWKGNKFRHPKGVEPQYEVKEIPKDTKSSPRLRSNTAQFFGNLFK